MPRIRTIKPDFWTDDKIVGLSPMARLFFIGMWNFADDHGGIERSPLQLKMKIFPGDDVDVEPLVQELLRSGMVAEYEASGAVYLNVVNFLRHQRIDRPSTPRIPAFKDGVLRPFAEDSSSTRRVLTEDSSRTRRRKGSGSGSGSGKEEDLEGKRNRRGARGEPTPESEASSVPANPERTTFAEKRKAGGNGDGNGAGKGNIFEDANKITDPKLRAAAKRMLRRARAT